MMIMVMMMLLMIWLIIMMLIIVLLIILIMMMTLSIVLFMTMVMKMIIIIIIILVMMLLMIMIIFISDAKRTESDMDNDVFLEFPEANRSHDKEVKERRRLSALKDYQVGAKEATVDRKSSKGNIFTTFRSGVKAVFQGRKVKSRFFFKVLVML